MRIQNFHPFRTSIKHSAAKFCEPKIVWKISERFLFILMTIIFSRCQLSVTKKHYLPDATLFSKNEKDRSETYSIRFKPKSIRFPWNTKKANTYVYLYTCVCVRVLCVRMRSYGIEIGLFKTTAFSRSGSFVRHNRTNYILYTNNE